MMEIETTPNARIKQEKLVEEFVYLRLFYGERFNEFSTIFGQYDTHFARFET